MTQQEERTLAALTAIESLPSLSQRALATQLGVSVGTANGLVQALLKNRLIARSRKGNGYRLTPSGSREKSRLLQRELPKRVDEYAEIRDQITERLASLGPEHNRVVFYGAGDIAQIAYAAVSKTGLELVGLIDDTKKGMTFFEFVVADRPALKGTQFGKAVFDTVVLATHSHTREMTDKLVGQGVPPERILALFE